MQWNSVITNSLGPANFVRFNWVNLCSKITNLPWKSVCYNRVFVTKRVRYNRVSLCLTNFVSKTICEILARIFISIQNVFKTFFLLWISFLLKFCMKKKKTFSSFSFKSGKGSTKSQSYKNSLKKRLYLTKIALPQLRSNYSFVLFAIEVMNRQ
jgi:hypothetical protein